MRKEEAELKKLKKIKKVSGGGPTAAGTAASTARATPRKAIHGSRNRDPLTNKAMHTRPLADVLEDQKTGPDGEYPPARVISCIAPVVVRQNDTAGPKYQEALGDTFLLNSPKYPGLCKMDDGTLVLMLTAALSGEVVVQEGRTFLDENTRLIGVSSVSVVIWAP